MLQLPGNSNGLRTLSVNADLTANPLTGVVLSTGVIKIVAAAPTSGNCGIPNHIATVTDGEIQGWATHIQNSNFAETETASQVSFLQRYRTNQTGPSVRRGHVCRAAARVTAPGRYWNGRVILTPLGIVAITTVSNALASQSQKLCLANVIEGNRARVSPSLLPRIFSLSHSAKAHAGAAVSC